MAPYFYTTTPSPFGHFIILWREDSEGCPHVVRIYLSDGTTTAEEKRRGAIPDDLTRSFVSTSGATSDPIQALGHDIGAFLEGEVVSFDLTLMNMARCTPFQRRVLEAEYAIPRGWVSTYGLIARHLGVPQGGRAVGGALARNPFPIVIPCHRAIRADHTLGGYQGGTAMKRALLQAEGLQLNAADRVLNPDIYYAP